MNIIEKIFSNNKLSCEEELNILDIEDDIFYSLDNNASIYIKVDSVFFECLSSNEKSNIVKRLYRELAGETGIIKIITISLPISTLEVDKYLNKKRNNSKNSFKRCRLLDEINDINEFINKEKMVERRFIVQLFQKNEENVYEKLEKRAKEIVIKLQNAGIKSHILDKKGILQLFNAFLNMKFEDEEIIYEGDDNE